LLRCSSVSDVRGSWEIIGDEDYQIGKEIDYYY
jgi:hypothetical protein